MIDGNRRILLLATCLLLPALALSPGCRRDTAPQQAGVVKNAAELSLVRVEASALREYEAGVDYRYQGLSGEYYDFACEAGAVTVVVPEYGTYFIYWLPEGWATLPEKRVMVLQHGHDGTAAPRIHDLYENAAGERFGLVSIQWGWRPGRRMDYRYLDESTEGMKIAYQMMELALDYIDLHHGVDRELSAWNGFSRSSGHSIVHAYLDRKTGNNYFRLFMGIAGGLNIEMPFIRGLVEGEYGVEPVEGRHFYLWAGLADAVPEERLIEGYPDTVAGRQAVSARVLAEKGGVVERYRQTPKAGHMYWNNNPDLQQEAIGIWYDMG